MEDLKALTECAECSWDYIDRLRMALASACKERDELKKQLHEAKSELDELRKTFDMFGGYDGIQNAFSERDALIHEAGEDKCALALMAYQYFNDTEGILWNECMSAGEAACRQLGLPDCFDKNMLWSMIEDYENTGKWRGPQKEA